jgi:hypothetical protein
MVVIFYTIPSLSGGTNPGIIKWKNYAILKNEVATTIIKT